MNNFSLKTESYLTQNKKWPQEGRHIMAQYDENNITVYQAYRPEIGRSAAKHQRFVEPFSFSRMSWIKPNFLWMMYRSGWGTKMGQEVILAVTIPRSFFDEILALAVPSTYCSQLYPDQQAWKDDVASSEVRLQWDPDHGPKGQSLERRAIQLGLRGKILERYAITEVVHIEDISEFVAEQRGRINQLDQLIIPQEQVYMPANLGDLNNMALS